ncbi:MULTISPECIES: TonB-dependent siderophore receptor [Sphingobium]|jgi:iron complex outermembrane receptor protein|nr:MULTISPECIES: TonB-dependent siderophore receptor [Sphingobium]QNG43925.1 TonB-dependent siderophore receptor [Sphingobium yanoikuyae]
MKGLLLGVATGAILVGSAAMAQTSAVPEDAPTERDQRDTIIVTGQRETRLENAPVGALGTLKALDTPFSVSVVDAADIASRQALTITEALRGDPSITPAGNGYQNESTTIIVRGFIIGERNTRIDGAPFYNASDVPIEAFERVDLLRGLSGFLYGFTSPGGIVNYTIKRPTETTQLGVDMGFVSRGIGRAYADFSGPIDSNGRLGFRLGGLIEDGESFTRKTYVHRESFSAALRFRPTDTLTLDLDYIDSYREQDGDLFGILASAAFAIPEPIDGSRRVAQTFLGYETHLKTVGANLAWSFAPNWSASVNLRDSRTERTFHDSFLVLSNAAGDYSETQATNNQNVIGQQAQVMVDGKFSTGPLEHNIVFGGAILRQERNRGKSSTSAVLGTGNLSNPGLFANPNLAIIRDRYNNQNVREKAGFISDTIDIGNIVKVIAGGRYTRYEQDDYSYSLPLATRLLTRAYGKSTFTPSFALVVKPAENISLYGSYVESMEPGGTAPATARNAFEVFAPIRSKQFEVGAKAQFGAFTLAAALFRIDKGLEYVSPSNVYVQDGEQRHDGVEFSFNGSPVQGLHLSGGVTFLDAKVRQAAAAVTGKVPQGVAEKTATLLADWTLPGQDAIALTGSVQYVGKRPVDATNVNFVDGYAIGSVGARYNFELGGKPVVARVSVENATDTKYWGTAFGYLTVGMPRNLRFSLATKL